MELAAAERKYDDLHHDAPWHDGTFENWSAEKSPAFPYGHRDGVQLWISPVDVDPDDRFLSPASAEQDAQDGDGEDEQ